MPTLSFGISFMFLKKWIINRQINSGVYVLKKVELLPAPWETEDTVKNIDFPKHEKIDNSLIELNEVHAKFYASIYSKFKGVRAPVSDIYAVYKYGERTNIRILFSRNNIGAGGGEPYIWALMLDSGYFWSKNLFRIDKNVKAVFLEVMSKDYWKKFNAHEQNSEFENPAYRWRISREHEEKMIQAGLGLILENPIDILTNNDLYAWLDRLEKRIDYEVVNTKYFNLDGKTIVRVEVVSKNSTYYYFDISRRKNLESTKGVEVF